MRLESRRLPLKADGPNGDVFVDIRSDLAVSSLLARTCLIRLSIVDWMGKERMYVGRYLEDEKKR